MEIKIHTHFSFTSFTNCNRRRKLRRGNLSLYRSKKKTKFPLNSCGCTSTKVKSTINSPEDDSDLDILKCNFYLKTKGRWHKLCCGQNRKYRRWRQQTSSVSHVSNLSHSHSPVDTPDLTSLISNRNDDV